MIDPNHGKSWDKRVNKTAEETGHMERNLENNNTSTYNVHTNDI